MTEPDGSSPYDRLSVGRSRSRWRPDAASVGAVDDPTRRVPYRRQPVDLSEPLVYEKGPDSYRSDAVPVGTTTSFVLDGSDVYPGTTRTVLLHETIGCRDHGPAPVLVVDDGSLYADPDGDLRVPIVLDALVAAGSIPALVAVLVDPGAGTRNAEYDPADGRYAGFLEAEVLPEVARRVPITSDPALRAICGGSSGGVAAFTAAWQRPDLFRRVAGFVSSFAQIPGGNPYPALIRSEPPRPLRVFLQAATRDLGFDRPTGNWLAANLETAAALAERGYDLRFVLGDGGHSTNHAGAVMPDALRWLWRD